MEEFREVWQLSHTVSAFDDTGDSLDNDDSEQIRVRYDNGTSKNDCHRFCQCHRPSCVLFENTSVTFRAAMRSCWTLSLNLKVLLVIALHRWSNSSLLKQR